MKCIQKFCLISLFTSQSKIFQLCQDESSWVEIVICLAQGHNAVTCIYRFKHQIEFYKVNKFPCFHYHTLKAYIVTLYLNSKKSPQKII